LGAAAREALPADTRTEMPAGRRWRRFRGASERPRLCAVGLTERHARGRRARVLAAAARRTGPADTRTWVPAARRAVFAARARGRRTGPWGTGGFATTRVCDRGSCASAVARGPGRVSAGAAEPWLRGPSWLRTRTR